MTSTPGWYRRWALVLAWAVLVVAIPLRRAAAQTSATSLERVLSEVLPVLRGEASGLLHFCAYQRHGANERLSFELLFGRTPLGAWQLEVRVDGRRGRICFDPQAPTQLEVGHSGCVIHADPDRADLEARAELQLETLLRDAGQRWPALQRGVALLQAATPAGCIGLLKLFFELKADAEAAQGWQLQWQGDAWRMHLDGTTAPLVRLVRSDGAERYTLDRLDYAPASAIDPQRAQRVAGGELERMLRRAFLRAAGLMHERSHAAVGTSATAQHGVGELRENAGFKTLLLYGDPYAMGHAHGGLLAEGVRANIDATLAVVGLVYTVERERWFLDEIRAAFARLQPHIAPRHAAELDGIADGAGIPRDELRIANVFPELFHCSGFALSSSATADGEVLHGRVLDYMTEIGLQNHAVLFVQAPTHGFAFANVGYAGFVGSVTGCNDRGLSIGEMGGRGEGAWDGEPMAFLLRRALEEAADVPQALQVYKCARRTCEYFYVMAHGPSRSAVGVAAWPRRIEILGPGVAHALLPHAVADCVLLSAGSRYEELVRRVRVGHGRFDVASALRLMDPGVAMSSNLHNVLFAPARGEVWIAHAADDGGSPAAKQPYRRVELAPLFEEVRAGRADFAAAAQGR